MKARTKSLKPSRGRTASLEELTPPVGFSVFLFGKSHELSGPVRGRCGTAKALTGKTVENGRRALATPSAQFMASRPPSNEPTFGPRYGSLAGRNSTISHAARRMARPVILLQSPAMCAHPQPESLSRASGRALSSKRGRAQARKLPHARYEGSSAKRHRSDGKQRGWRLSRTLAKAQGKRVLAFAPGNRVILFPLSSEL